MLETSNDLLNLVIALCVLLFTIFLCWMFYYMVMIFRKINEVMGKITSTLEAISSLVTKAKDKLDKTASNFSILLELGKKAFEFVKERQENKKKKGRKIAEEE